VSRAGLQRERQVAVRSPLHPSLRHWSPDSSSCGITRLARCLKLVHTADTDETRQSCLVRVGGVNKLLEINERLWSRWQLHDCIQLLNLFTLTFDCKSFRYASFCGYNITAESEHSMTISISYGVIRA